MEVAGRLQAESAPAGRCGRAVATPPGGRPRPRVLPLARVGPPGARASLGAKDGPGPALMMPAVAGTGSRAASATSGARVGAARPPPQPATRAVHGGGMRGDKRLSAAVAERQRSRRPGSLKPACVNDGLRLPSILCRGSGYDHAPGQF